MTESYYEAMDKMMTHIDEAQKIVNQYAFSSRYDERISKSLRQLTGQLGYFHIMGGLVKKTYNNPSSELYRFLSYGRGFNHNILDYVAHLESGYLVSIFFIIEGIMKLAINKEKKAYGTFANILEEFVCKSELDENDKNILKCGAAIRNSLHNEGIHIHDSFYVTIDGKEFKFEKDKEIEASISDIPIAILGGIKILLIGLDRLK